MPDADAIVPNFHGNFSYGIDSSRRVMMPARWRPEDPNVLFTFILWPINVEEYLLVLPPERWRVMLDKLKTQSLGDEGVASIERVIGSTSAQLTLDRAGRFSLPEHLMGPAGLTDKAEFVARLHLFEIWTPERRAVAVVKDKTLAASEAKRINL